MKRHLAISIAVVLWAATPLAGLAQASNPAPGEAKAAVQQVQGSTHKGVGVVRKIDPAKGTITLAHERIASLNWPPMVMAFTVKDKALLDKAQAGKRVEFVFVQQGRDNVITSLK